MVKLSLAPPVKEAGGQRRSDDIKTSCHVDNPCDADGNPLSEAARRDPDVARYAVPPKMRGKTALWKFTVRARVGSPLYRLLRAAGRPVSETIFAPGWDEALGRAALVAEAWKQTPDPKLAVHTLRDVVAKKLEVESRPESDTRPATVAGHRQMYAQCIIPACDGRDVREHDADFVDRFIRKFASKGKSQTRAMKVAGLQGVYRFAIERGWLDHSPILPEHYPVVAKVGTLIGGKIAGDARVARALDLDADVPKIIAQLEQDDVALVMLVRWLCWSGARAREALHVRLTDVTFAADGSAFVYIATGFACPCEHCARQGGVRLTKSGKPRLVPLHPSLVEPMRDYLAQHAAHFATRQPTLWLFPMWLRRGSSHATIGGIRTNETLRRLFQAAATAAGFPDLITHDTRSSAKTHWLLKGANPSAADYVFGHAIRGSAMNDVYAQFEQTPSKFYAACFPGWEPVGQPDLTVSSGGMQGDTRKVG